MKDISRREFVKGALAGAAGLTMAGILGGCGDNSQSGSGSSSVPASGAARGTYTPGTYSATSAGFSSDVTVTMTFDAERITDMQVDVSGETPDVGGQIGDKIIERILDAQSADVDSVTGATRSSEAVKQAAASCIAQAKGGPVVIPQAGGGDDPFTGEGPDGQTVYYSQRRSWLGEPPAIAEGDIAEEYSADVIIIGANYSGANCFRMASEKGACCIVLDSQPEEGFNSYGGDLGHFNSEWQEKVLGVPKDFFDPTDFIDSYQLQSAGRAQPDLIRQFAHRNGEMVDWMTELYDDVTQIGSMVSVNFQEENKDYDFKKGHFMTYPATLQLGTGSMASSGDFCKASVQKGIQAGTGSQAFYEMTAKVLVKDGDTVCGVIAQSEADGKYYRFMAKKGVVLATGDFSANGEMYRSLCTEVQECNPYDEITGNGRSGYGHRMGIWAGGVMEPGPRAAMGGSTAPFPGALFKTTAALWINKYGKRFCNEGFGSPFVAACQSARQPIGGSLFQVWDEGHWREMLQNQSLGHFNSDDITNAKVESCAATLAEVRANGGMPVVAAAAESSGGEGAPGGAGGPGGEGAPGGAGGPGGEGGGPGGGAGGPGGGGNEIYCADTLEELAAKLGFEGEYANNFVEAVQRYDAMAAAGKDEDYAKAPNLLFRINEGPFYAEKLSRSSNMVLVTLAGLFVDGHQQCLDQNFEPIPGLFATGNTSGGRFPLQYTAAMNGLSIGFATVFGALLGEYLGQEAPDVSTGDSATSAKGTQG